MNVTVPSVVPNLAGDYGPEIYFDPVPGADWPQGCWMCGIPEQDHYCGATPNDALAAWEASGPAKDQRSKKA